MSKNIANWPPAKGPTPPRFSVVNREIDAYPISRSTFRFWQPPAAVAERVALLDAIGDPHVDRLDGPLKIVHPESDPKPYRTFEREFLLNHHVESVGSLSAVDARKMVSGWSRRRRRFEWQLAPKAVTFELTYPLSLGVRVKVKPYNYVVEYADGDSDEWRELSLGYVLWVAAQEYLRVYERWREFRVWGHALRDLWFRRLSVRKAKARIFVGS